MERLFAPPTGDHHQPVKLPSCTDQVTLMEDTVHITPCLWFDNNGEEAIQFYMSIFKESKMGEVFRNGDNGPGPKGTMLTGTFTLLGREFMVLNGGPQFKFTEAISFSVSCANQQEVDYLWEKLSSGGRESMCGWLQDRYGLSWQIVPRRLIDLLADEDRVKAARVMEAMLKMRKIDIATLDRAYGGA